jgi:ribosomal-protein-alanine N-acetyltransferase
LFEFGDEKAEIGYELLPAFYGKGLMYEAASKVLEFAFLHIGLESVEAHSHADNQSSTKLLKILDFEKQSPDVDDSATKIISFKLDKSTWKRGTNI